MSAPAGIVVLGPGGYMTAGRRRQSTIELKLTPGKVVVDMPAGAVLRRPGLPDLDVGTWHATIHADLFSSVRPTGRPDPRHELSPPPTPDLRVPRRLFTLALAPPNHAQAEDGRFQHEWTGAVICGPMRDAAFDDNRTSLLVDAWAVPTALSAENWCPPCSFPSGRPAADRNGHLKFSFPLTAFFPHDRALPGGALTFTFWFVDLDLVTAKLWPGSWPHDVPVGSCERAWSTGGRPEPYPFPSTRHKPAGAASNPDRGGDLAARLGIAG